MRLEVMGPLITSGSFFRSASAARGIPKFETGPQKCVEQTYLMKLRLNKKSAAFLNDIFKSVYDGIGAN